MKKALIAVVLASIVILTFVGCSDSNIIERTIVVQNSSGRGITYLDFSVGSYFESGSRIAVSYPPVILADTESIELSQVFDKTVSTVGYGTLYVGSDTSSGDIARIHRFTFEVDNEENVVITITYESPDLVLAGTGGGYEAADLE